MWHSTFYPWMKSLDIELVGWKYTLSTDTIKEGDQYVAETRYGCGPRLLTAKKVVLMKDNPNNPIKEDHIIPVEPGYYYDLDECRKVVKVESVPITVELLRANNVLEFG